MADTLGATRGGSRVVCDAGHLPRDRQIGASGTLVTARCYFALGIAGAPQHLQGITEVKHVIAVNTDLHAEMIKRADLAIVADAQAVMPALIRYARERRNAQTMVEIAVLLSVGSHPASGRARRAPLDAQALELALRLTESGQAATRIHALHAGNPSEPALRDYLGMGLDRLEVLETAPGADPVPALTARLRDLSPALILAGSVAEGGEDSGMVPYLIAQALNRTLVPDIVGIDFTDAEAALTQALPRGQRRLITASPASGRDFA